MHGCRSLVFLLMVLACPVSLAGVTVGFDVSTLNELLPAVTLDEVQVPLAGGRTVQLRLRDLRVTGLDPSGDAGNGEILTSMRVEVPSVGASFRVEPRLGVRVAERDGESWLELRFASVPVPLPMIGQLDIGAFLSPLHYPADAIFLLDGNAGPVPVRSRLIDVKMGTSALRLEFELSVTPDR